MSKTIKSLKRNRKKYNTGGIVPPVVPTAIETVEETPSLMQPQETPESAAGAAQKTMPMESGVAPAFRPDDFQGEGSDFAPPVDTTQFSNPTAEEIAAFEESQVPDPRYEAFLESQAQAETPAWTGGNAQSIKNAANYAALGIPTSEGDLAQFDYNGDGQLTSADYEAIERGDIPGLLAAQAQLEQAADTDVPTDIDTADALQTLIDAQQQQQPAAYSGSTDLPENATPEDLSLRIKYITNVAGAPAANAFKNSLKESNPDLYYEAFPQEVYNGSTDLPRNATGEDLSLRIKYITNVAGAPAANAFKNSLKESNPDLYYEAFPDEMNQYDASMGILKAKDYQDNPELMRSYYDYLVATRSRGSTSFKNEIIAYPALFNAAFPEEQQLSVPTQPELEPVQQPPAVPAYNPQQDPVSYVMGQRLEMSPEIMQARASYLDNYSADDIALNNFYDEMKASYPSVFKEAFPELAIMSTAPTYQLGDDIPVLEDFADFGVYDKAMRNWVEAGNELPPELIQAVDPSIALRKKITDDFKNPGGESLNISQVLEYSADKYNPEAANQKVLLNDFKNTDSAPIPSDYTDAAVYEQAIKSYNSVKAMNIDPLQKQSYSDYVGNRALNESDVFITANFFQRLDLPFTPTTSGYTYESPQPKMIDFLPFTPEVWNEAITNWNAVQQEKINIQNNFEDRIPVAQEVVDRVIPADSFGIIDPSFFESDNEELQNETLYSPKLGTNITRGFDENSPIPSPVNYTNYNTYKQALQNFSETKEYLLQVQDFETPFTDNGLVNLETIANDSRYNSQSFYNPNGLGNPFTVKLELDSPAPNVKDYASPGSFLGASAFWNTLQSTKNYLGDNIVIRGINSNEPTKLDENGFIIEEGLGTEENPAPDLKTFSFFVETGTPENRAQLEAEYSTLAEDIENLETPEELAETLGTLNLRNGKYEFSLKSGAQKPAIGSYRNLENFIADTNFYKENLFEKVEIASAELQRQVDEGNVEIQAEIDRESAELDEFRAKAEASNTIDIFNIEDSQYYNLMEFGKTSLAPRPEYYSSTSEYNNALSRWKNATGWNTLKDENPDLVEPKDLNGEVAPKALPNTLEDAMETPLWNKQSYTDQDRIAPVRAMYPNEASWARAMQQWNLSGNEQKEDLLVFNFDNIEIMDDGLDADGQEISAPIQEQEQPVSDNILDPEPEPVPEVDADGRPLPEFYTYEGLPGQMPRLADYNPQPGDPEPDLSSFENTPADFWTDDLYLNYQAKWDLANPPEPETPVVPDTPVAPPAGEVDLGGGSYRPDDFVGEGANPVDDVTYEDIFNAPDPQQPQQPEQPELILGMYQPNDGDNPPSMDDWGSQYSAALEKWEAAQDLSPVQAPETPDVTDTPVVDDTPTAPVVDDTSDNILDPQPPAIDYGNLTFERGDDAPDYNLNYKEGNLSQQYVDDLDSWASAQVFEGSSRPQQGTFTPVEYDALLRAWYDAGNTDDAIDEIPDTPVVDDTPDTPVVDDTPTEPVVDDTPDTPVVDDEIDTDINITPDTPDTPVTDDTPADTPSQEEPQYEELISSYLGVEDRDYNSLFGEEPEKPEWNPRGATDYQKRNFERYNDLVSVRNDLVKKLDDTYNLYAPMLEQGQLTAPPQPGSLVPMPAALPDYATHEQVVEYNKQKGEHEISKIRLNLYMEAQKQFRESLGDDMGADNQVSGSRPTQVRESNVIVSDQMAALDSAPTGLRQQTPVTPNISMDAEEIDSSLTSGTVTRASQIQSLDAAGTGSAQTVGAGTLPALGTQATPDEVAGLAEGTDLSSDYTAETIDEAAEATAQTFNTVNLVKASADGVAGAAATAAQRDAISEQDAQASRVTKGVGLSAQSVAVAQTAFEVAKGTARYQFLENYSAERKAERDADTAYINAKAAYDEAPEGAEKEALFEALNKVPTNKLYIDAERAKLTVLENAGKTRLESVEGPSVASGYEAAQISTEALAELINIADDRGVDIDDLPDYSTLKTRSAQTLNAEDIAGLEGVAATGTAGSMGESAPGIDTSTALEAGVATRSEDFSLIDETQIEMDDLPSFNDNKATLQEVDMTGFEQAQRISAASLDEEGIILEEEGTVDLDLEGRTAMISASEAQGTKSEIGQVPTFETSTKQFAQGQDREVGAIQMVTIISEIPEDVAEQVSKDPASYTGATDTAEATVVASKVAALPAEALVSAQMETLLAGMEEGETPAWARPAVALVESNMAKRGLSASTVGRDALFNAIITTALPMAESNARALQARAAQNLDISQQNAVIKAQNTMTLRMQNLANTQTGASQSAAMAQEMKVKNVLFEQQQITQRNQEQQQLNLQNLQNQQQVELQRAEQAQQQALTTFSEEARQDFEILKAKLADTSTALNVDEQMRLKQYEAQINKQVVNAQLASDMEKANLSADLQYDLQVLTEQNSAARDTMTAENQERLVELQTLVDFRKTNASFAQQMDMANLTNDQQIEMAVLRNKQEVNAANFTADNQFRLAELNAKIARQVRMSDLLQRTAEINLDTSTKLELAELTEANATARANMSVAQQTRLANLNSLIDFKKTNANLTQQMELANLSNEQQIRIATLSEKSAADQANFSEANRYELARLTTAAQVLSSNEELKMRADMARLSTEERVSLANLTSKSQFESASMTAENTAELQRYEKQMQAAQVNANLAQQMGLQELSNAQQTAMFNAQVNSNLDFKVYDTEQQMSLANSQFMQTMTIKEFDAQQQAAIQNATLLANINMAEADQATKLAVTNAQNFLRMDMANLTNSQQVAVLNAQMEQQALISNVASENAAAQFGAASQQQADQFMANLGVQIEKYNVSALAARNQFNASEKNRQAAIAQGNYLQAASITAQMDADMQKFNEQQDLARDQWNASNAQAVEQSNVQWRRQANTANTAAQNSANQQNAQISFNLTSQEQTQLWQQLRDEAAYVRQAYENDQQRKAQLLATALSNESVKSIADFEAVIDLDYNGTGV